MTSVAIDIRVRPADVARAQTLWQSTIGKKAVMAVTGLIMVLFLLVHMLGNLKIFFGPHDFNGYAAWLRTIGEPVLHGAWFLWIQRAVLRGRARAARHLRGAAVQARPGRAPDPLRARPAARRRPSPPGRCAGAA